MGDVGGPSESSGGHGSGSDLPVMPGPEKPLLHIAIEYVEMLDNALAEHQMLNVAHGELPAEAACIIAAVLSTARHKRPLSTSPKSPHTLRTLVGTAFAAAQSSSSGKCGPRLKLLRRLAQLRGE